MNTRPWWFVAGFAVCGSFLLSCAGIHPSTVQHGWVIITDPDRQCYERVRGYQLQWVCHI